MPKSKGRRKAKRKPPPPPKPDPVMAKGPSPGWYAAIMFALMGGGLLVIVLNYIAIFGDTRNAVLLAGLGMIAVGFGMTLNYR